MKLFKVFVVLSFCLLISNCATQKPAHQKSIAIDPASLDTEQRKRYLNATLAAESAVRQQQFGVAANQYLVAARIIDSIEYAEKAIHYAERAEDHIASIQAAQFWHQLAPLDRTAISWKILGELRSHQNKQLQKSLELLFKLTREQPAGRFLNIMESVTSIAAGPATQKQIEIFANNHPNETEAWLVLARVMEQLHDLDQALVYIDKALSINSRYIPAHELKGLILLRAGDTIAAQDYFQDAVQSFPEENKLKLQLAQIYYQQNQYSKSITLASQILEKDPNVLAARYLLAAIYFIQEKYVLSEVQFLILLDKGYKKNTVYYFLGEINVEISKNDIAVQFFDAVSSGRNLARSRVNSAKILAENGKLEEALQRLRNARTSNFRDQVFLASTEVNLLKKTNHLEKNKKEILKTFTRNPTNVYLLTRAIKIAKHKAQRKQILQISLAAAETLEVYKALIEISFGLSNQFGDTDVAMEILNEYLQQYSDDTTLRYSRAMLRAQIGDIKGMDQDLRDILRLEPDNTDALNALGYSMADQKQDLEKAYKMILTAFKKRPNSAAIIDSLGWVLFRKGEFDKALTHLEKAWDKEPSAEVGAHFGEVLWITNKKQKAEIIWKQALELDSENKVLLDTIKRLQQ